ncbi:MAG: bifunctional riboflavin kinase/FAD synthetase [Lachnospiraceae bacterium]|nr:bifunctional riboflavin kinase/FAD synthetase [Lachnospiraceae bacterium]
MEIVTYTKDLKLDKETAVAIGKFDGVHKGHRRLLSEIICKKEHGLQACVLTFDPAPAVFFGWSDGRELTTREEKYLLFERMGIDVVVEFPMTELSASMEPEAFAEEVLKNSLQAAYICAGTDLSFGAGGKGNAALLHSLQEKLDFTVETIDKVSVGGKVVSSTYARELLEQGDMEELSKYLDMPYMLVGEVVHGKRLGRNLGFPTVNLLPDEKKLLPPNGVYYAKVRYGGKEYRAISNIGYKPTVTKEHICGVETYLYDFDEEIYGEYVEISLLKFKRPERRFESVEALKMQLFRDIEEGKEYDL